jgi:hypothetical protein
MQRIDRLRTKQPMCIGDHANPHVTRVEQQSRKWRR